MKLNGTEVFSRQTIVSWRILVTLSSTLIAIKFFNYNTEVWPVLGREVAPEEFKIISAVTIFFLLAAHLINWSGDYVGFTKWFKINAVPIDGVFSYGAVENSEPPILSVQRRLKALKRSNDYAKERLLDLEAISVDDLKSMQGDRGVAKHLEKMRSTVSDNNNILKKLASEIKELQTLHSDLNVNFKTISIASRFLLFGWYLMVPGVLALTALVL